MPVGGIKHIVKCLRTLWFGGTNYDKLCRELGPDEWLGENIYCADMTRREFTKRANRIHTWFKHIFLIPALHYACKVLGKHLVTKVPEKPEYRNLLVFETAFHNTMVDWADTVPGASKEATEKQMRESHPIKWMNQMKDIMVTVLVNDTAYFEMFNMLMYNIAKEMNKAHKDSGGVPKHLVYLGPGISDVRYFGIIRNNVLNQMFPGKKVDTLTELKGSGYPRQELPLMAMRPPIKQERSDADTEAQAKD